MQLRLIYKVDGIKTLNERYHAPLGLPLMLAEYALFRRGPMTMAPSQLGLFTRSDTDQERANLEYHIQPLSLDRFGEPLHKFPAFTASVANLRPTSRGHIRLRSRDPAAAPAIKPNYLSTDEDRHIAVKSIRLTRHIVAQPALAPYHPSEYLPGAKVRDDDEQALARAAGDIGTTIFHPVGTAKMGLPSDPMMVVDERLRVAGVERLRVIDASVMPTITSGNTNAPTMMIAEKGAAMIRADGKGSRNECGLARAGDLVQSFRRMDEDRKRIRRRGVFVDRLCCALAIVPAVSGFIGACFVGAAVPGNGIVRAPILEGFFGAVFGYVVTCATVLVLGFVIDFFAPMFGARRDFGSAFKLAVYSYTPVWLAGVFLLAPGLRFLILTAFYGVFILWQGLPRLMETPRDECAPLRGGDCRLRVRGDADHRSRAQHALFGSRRVREPSSWRHQHLAARSRQTRHRGSRSRLRRFGRRRWIQHASAEPIIQFVPASFAGFRRRLRLALRAVGRTINADVEVIIVPTPWPHLGEPGAIVSRPPGTAPS